MNGSQSLGKAAQAAIADEDNEVFVSAASAMEVTLKFRLGKLAHAQRLALGFEQEIAEEGFVPLAITLSHAAAAGAIKIPHKDPFDRLLIAQSQVESLILVSNEKLFDSFGVRRLW